MRVNISIFGYIYIKINLLCNRIYYSEIDLNCEFKWRKILHTANNFV